MWNFNINSFSVLGKNVYLLAILWTLMFFNRCDAKPPDMTTEQYAYFKEGLSVIEQFYHYMLSNDDLKDCPDIFEVITGSTIERERANEVIQIWKFVRDNTTVLTGPLRYGSPDKFFATASKSYRMHLTRYGGPEGELVVVAFDIILHLYAGNMSGITKEISFPLEYNEKQKRFLIDSGGIKVNGIQLEWTTLYYIEGYRKFERDFDWLEQLGFPKKKESSR